MHHYLPTGKGGRDVRTETIFTKTADTNIHTRSRTYTCVCEDEWRERGRMRDKGRGKNEAGKLGRFKKVDCVLRPAIRE